MLEYLDAAVVNALRQIVGGFGFVFDRLACHLLHSVVVNPFKYASIGFFSLAYC